MDRAEVDPPTRRRRLQHSPSHNRRVSEHLHDYLRQRSQTLGLSLSEVSRRAGLSRQTLYGLGQAPQKLPALQTVVALAVVLEVHPLRLLQALFDDLPLRKSDPPASARQTDRSAFVQDVSFPDGALVLPGQRFVKTWEVQNAGSVPWVDRHLQCMDDEVLVYTRTGTELLLGAPLLPDSPRLAVPPTAPGQVVRLSMGFTAPNSPGTVLSYWKSTFADGSLCFPEARGLWVKVRVSSMASGATEMRGAPPAA